MSEGWRGPKDGRAKEEKPEILMRSEHKCGGSKREKELEEQEVLSRTGIPEMEFQRQRNPGRWQGQGSAAGGEGRGGGGVEVTASCMVRPRMQWSLMSSRRGKL